MKDWGPLLNHFGPEGSHATSTHILQQKAATQKQARLRDAVPAGHLFPVSGSALWKGSTSLWSLAVCPCGEGAVNKIPLLPSRAS